MFYMDRLNSGDLLRATDDHTKLRFDHVVGRLGMGAVISALDETSQHYSDHYEDTPNPRTATEAMPSQSWLETVAETEDEFMHEIIEEVGEVNGYRVLDIHTGVLFLNKAIPSSNGQICNETLHVSIDSDGSILLQKRSRLINTSSRAISSEDIPVIEDDERTIETIITKLLSVNEQLHR